MNTNTNRKTSPGGLDEYERGWTLQFVNGRPWVELPEALEDGSTPPAWLVAWSVRWGAYSNFTIEEMDPYWSHGDLATDRTDLESWVAAEEPDQTPAHFEREPVANRIPEVDFFRPIVLKYLQSAGDFPVLGHFTLTRAWLARPVMRDFMELAMRKAGETCQQGDTSLALEAWLQREYGASTEEEELLRQ